MNEDGQIEEWKLEQIQQSTLASFSDNLSFSVSDARPSNVLGAGVHRVNEVAVTVEGLSRIGGLNIAFRIDDSSDSSEDAIATLAILSYPSLQLLHQVSRQIVVRVPYIPGFLSYREAAPLSALLEGLDPRLVPQLLFVNGNGSLHERGAGSAVVVGLRTNIPTIGVAKEFHPVVLEGEEHECSQRGMREYARTMLQKRGEYFGLYGSDRLSFVGAALLSSPSKNATRPIFVAPGHLISLETSVSLALLCSPNARVPEPIRSADSIGRAAVKRIWG